MFPTPDRIMNLSNAFFNSCVLFTASDVGVFSFLSKEKSADSEIISAALKKDRHAMRMLLDACTALRLLEKNGLVYSLTEESLLYLVPGSPADLSNAIRYNRDVYNAWGKLPELIENGKPVEKPELHLGDDESRTRTFVYSMHYRALAIGKMVIPHLDLSNVKNVLDIAGGPGTFSVMIAEKYPEITCHVLDLPPVVEIAEELIRQKQMQSRVKVLSGDYHTTKFPDGNDAVLFFGCLHQECESSIRKLLKKAFDNMNKNGKVIIMDMMTDKTRTAPQFSTMFALNMALTKENGWVFSDEDIITWLEDTGFCDINVTCIGSGVPHWIVSAKKIIG